MQEAHFKTFDAPGFKENIHQYAKRFDFLYSDIDQIPMSCETT